MSEYYTEVEFDELNNMWDWRVHGPRGLDAEGSLYADEFDDTEQVAQNCANAVMIVLQSAAK